MRPTRLRKYKEISIRFFVFTFFIIISGFITLNTANSQVINVPAGDADALIQAIDDANVAPNQATINLGGGTYNLTQINNNTDGDNGLPVIITDIIINGNDSIVQRSDNPATPEFRIFLVDADNGIEPNVTFNNLTIRNGIENEGAAIQFSSDGVANINDSLFTENSEGSVINNNNFGTMNINRSTITQNTNFDSTQQSTVVNDFGGTMNITESTISFNTGQRNGGVNNNSSGTTNITNTTIYGNRSIGLSTTTAGGVYNNSGGDIFISFSTISNNEGLIADNIGNNGSGDIFISNTIVGESIDSPSCFNNNVNGAIVSQGYNIDESGICGFASVGDKSGINPGLDRLGLQDNGGPTETLALIPGSPALDMADPACPPPTTDQRGFPRPAPGGDRCDIGAFEGVAMISVPSISQWGLIAMAGVLGLLGLLAVRRKAAA